MKTLCIFSKTSLSHKTVTPDFLRMQTAKDLKTRSFRFGKKIFVGTLKLALEPYQNPYRDRNNAIFIDGYIFNPKYINSWSVKKYSQKRDFFLSPEEVLRSYRKKGKKFLNSLNGSFHIVIIDSKNNRFEVITDRYGSNPLLIHEGKEVITIASELKGFPKKCFEEKNINWKSVASYFAYLQIFGNDTFIKSISVIPSGTICSYSNGTLSCIQYHSLEVKPINTMSSDAILKRAEMLYKNAILKSAYAAYAIMRKPLVLPLSGGYDTRLICSLIKKHTSIPFETISTDKDVSYYLDSIIAKKIAAILGVKNKTVYLSKTLYRKYLVKKIYLLEGMILEHLWMLPLAQSIKKPQVILDGLAGDSLGRGSEREVPKFIKGFKSKNKKKLVAKISSLFYPSKRPNKLGPGQFVARWKMEVEHLKPFLKAVTFRQIKQLRSLALYNMIFHLDLKSPSLFTYFYIEKNKRHSLYLPKSILGQKSFVMYPYLENNLFDFLAGIPCKTKLKMGFTRTILNKMIPDIMEIESTNDPFIKDHYKKLFPRNIGEFGETEWSSLFTEETKTFLKRTMHNIKLPSFIRLSKKDFTKAMNRLIENLNEKTEHHIVFIDFLIWYNLFIKRFKNQS